MLNKLTNTFFSLLLFFCFFSFLCFFLFVSQNKKNTNVLPILTFFSVTLLLLGILLHKLQNLETSWMLIHETLPQLSLFNSPFHDSQFLLITSCSVLVTSMSFLQILSVVPLFFASSHNLPLPAN